MKNIRLLLSVFFVITSFNLQAKTVYYVTATGTGDGSTWTNAANSIQTMIDKAISGDEVWVAKGTYYPTTETIARDPRSQTFLIKGGVNLYGGFSGSESVIAQRALADLNLDGKVDSCELVNTTILSGDIDGVADVWTKTINTDGKTWKWTVTGNEGNCYNVVSGGSIFNGFTVIGGNANNASLNKGGGIYACSLVTNCTVSNCSVSGNGGGIYSHYSSVTNCTVSNCLANSYGGGIYADSYYTSSVTNCTVSNCSASSYGSGIYADSSPVTNCTVSNCSVSGNGGGIYSHSSPVTNCTVSNCLAFDGGGIYSNSPVTNCTVSNCSASGNGGGIFSYSSYATNCASSNCSAGSWGGGIYASSSSYATNCASSNNSTAGTIGLGISGGTQSSCISPSISDAYVQPTSFIGVATNDAQKLELVNANWRLKEGSPCINAGTSTNVSSTILSGKDIDSNIRVLYGSIDIGAYEYTLPKVTMPVSENFDNWSDFDKSEVFYRSAKLNTLNDIKWVIENQKAVLSWKTNLTSTYSQPIFTYQIDGTKSTKVFLRYDMFFQAYSGTISPLGTEKLNVEFSKDLVTWSTIATYSNANGTIANQTYKHDISTSAAGKTFFIRFNANGQNSNRIEKWEIDNVVIDADGISAVEVTKEDKLLYLISDSKLTLRNIEQGSYVQLFDINGKLIDSAKANSNTLDFILPVHGVYILRVSSESGITSRKVVL